MVNFQALEQLGFTREFFRIPPEQEHEPAFRYYITDRYVPQRDSIYAQPSYWDLIGVHSYQDSQGDVWDIRLIHLEEEELIPEEFPEYNTVHDASNLLSFDLDEWQALRAFFHQLVGNFVLDGSLQPTYFHRMTEEYLRRLHCRFFGPPYLYYRYTPEKTLQSENIYSFISLLDSTKFSRRSLFFTTFHQNQLEDPAFDPLAANGLGTMTFNAAALLELLSLMQ